MAGNRVTTRNIDESIVDLLGLSGDELTGIDYEDYRSRISEILIENELGDGDLSEEDISALQKELNKVKNKTGIFNIKVRSARVVNNNPLPTITPDSAEDTEKEEKEEELVIIDHDVDAKVLQLLNLKDGISINADDYFEKIKIKLVSHSLVNDHLPSDYMILLREELKVVQKIKDRKTKILKISEKKSTVSGDGSDTPPEGPEDGESAPPKTSAIVKAPPGSLSVDKFLRPNPPIEEVSVRDVTPQRQQREDNDPLNRIIERLDSIISTLTDLNRENRRESERQRRGEETRRRREREDKLESKKFDGIKSAIKKMMAPFQSIWDYILNFLWNVFLGKVVLKLIDWFADPKNKDSIKNIIRFFKDWWPTMLGAYILFGTAFGKFARTIVGVALKGTIGFGKVIARLIAAIARGKKLRVAGAFARGRTGLGGRPTPKGGGLKGALLKGGLAVGATLLTGLAIDKGVDALTGGGNETSQELTPPPSPDVPSNPKIPMLNAAGGGLADLAKVLSKFGGGGGLTGLLGPIAMLLGQGEGSLPQMFKGLVKGKKGTDKVPAMLTDGEFVMSKGAVQKYGLDTLESMNAAGGGTNIPKIVKGIPHAYGGGLIGDEEIRKQAAAASSPTGGTVGSRQYRYDSQNPHHVSNYEKLKKIAIKKGIYQPISDFYDKTSRSNTSSSETYSRQESTSSQRSQSSPPGSTPPPNSSSSRLIRSPASALSTDVRTPMQSISINKNVPGGRVRTSGPLAILLSALEFFGRKEQGQTNAQAALGAGGSTLGGSLGWMGGAKAGGLAGAAIGSGFGGVGAVPGALIGAGIGGIAGSFGGSMLGGKIADDVSGVNATNERMNRGGVGGKLMGGWGLKQQQFEDMPKTQVMTDDKGRPFIGYKAMRGGKPTYVRGPRPGTNTTNPLEMLGRMINPGAYRENDRRLALKNQKIAMVNSLESFQNQGMGRDAQSRMMMQMGGNLKDTENDLTYRRKMRQEGQSSSGGTRTYSGGQRSSRSRPLVPSSSQTRRSAVAPPVRPAPRYNPAGGGMNGGRGSRRGGSGTGSLGSVRQVAPSRGNTARQRRQLGINR